MLCITENCMAPHRTMETAYNITSFTLALQFFSTHMYLPICTYSGISMHNSECMNDRISPVSHAEPFLDVHCTGREAFKKENTSNHTIPTQKFRKLVHFLKYFSQKLYRVKNSKFCCHINYPLYSSYNTSMRFVYDL